MKAKDTSPIISELLGLECKTDTERDAARKLRQRFRDGLRGARARVHADAEGFEAIVHEIERLGRHLNPDGHALGDYHHALVALVALLARAERHKREFEFRLFLLRQTRNDAAHQGSHARNAAREAVWVALRLEEALSDVCWPKVELQHVMVKGAIATQPGDTLRDVRQAMLENAFTAIPALIDNRWYLLTDQWLAGSLAAKSGEARKTFLATPVAKLSAADLDPLHVEPLAETTKVSELGVLNRPLVLVGDLTVSPPRLVGVVAPSDLL